MKKTYTKKQITEAIAYWEKQLKKMNEQETTGTYVFPDLDDPKYNDPEVFLEEVNKVCGIDLYYDYVPDEETEIEGTQRDLDDFDVFRVNYRETIDEYGFADQFIERMADEYNAGDEITINELKKTAEIIGERIAINAIENYDPDDSHLIHRGVYKSERYWRS